MKKISDWGLSLWDPKKVYDIRTAATPEFFSHEACDSRFCIIIDFRKYCKNARKQDKMRPKSPGMLWKS